MTYEPFQILDPDAPSRWLITCDHAANTVPPSVGGGSLGLPDADMERHIAFDPGAAGVTRALADLLRAPAILSNFSRLVIDPNRGEDDPTLLMKLYDGSVIPANRHAGPEEKERRLAAFHRPYHEAYEALAARRSDRAICAIHSFTPGLRGRPPRPWQIGILHSHRDSRLAGILIGLLRDEGYVTGDNEPYDGHLDGDAIDRHALQHGRPNVLIELRNDLIETPEQQQDWARRLAPLLKRTLERAGV